MRLRRTRGYVVCLVVLAVVIGVGGLMRAQQQESPSAKYRTPAPLVRDLLYVAVPGVTLDDAHKNQIRVMWGGAGILVYDIALDYQLIKRIPTTGQEFTSINGARNYAGISVSIPAGLLYLQNRAVGVEAYDLLTEKRVWGNKVELCCDRAEVSPIDGMVLYAGGGGTSAYNGHERQDG